MLATSTKIARFKKEENVCDIMNIINSDPAYIKIQG
ncbi:Uncharacterised protein [uncultured archaeon]|nr:Uncharacterised protein [uncultured archaeon]